MATEIKDELKALYGDASKHSTYQSIPDFVSEALGYSENIDEGWRGDRPRLAYLLTSRQPAEGELWGDFGANTGFFTLSLAHRYPGTRFMAIEANSNHARFILRIADYFGLTNVAVMDHAIGLRELHELPKFDFLLHLNVLHHAGHDFDGNIVRTIPEFSDYAVRYLGTLRTLARSMLFQLGSNWGGDKQQPLVGVHDDVLKLRMFSNWLDAANWQIGAVAYPRKAPDGTVSYRDVIDAIDGQSPQIFDMEDNKLQRMIAGCGLNAFPGEFYRRPLFLCHGD